MREPNPSFRDGSTYFSLVTAIAMTPAACAVIYKTGPLAWDGAVSYWLRLGAFALNIAVMFFVLRSAINRQAAEELETSRNVLGEKVPQ